MVPTGGGPVEIPVAGMHPDTTYHMRAREDLGNGTILSTPTAPLRPDLFPGRSFPTVTVCPAGSRREAGVELNFR